MTIQNEMNKQELRKVLEEGREKIRLLVKELNMAEIMSGNRESLDKVTKELDEQAKILKEVLEPLRGTNPDIDEALELLQFVQEL